MSRVRWGNCKLLVSNLNGNISGVNVDTIGFSQYHFPALYFVDYGAFCVAVCESSESEDFRRKKISFLPSLLGKLNTHYCLLILLSFPNKITLSKITAIQIREGSVCVFTFTPEILGNREIGNRDSGKM